jgi:hypothetical protein
MDNRVIDDYRFLAEIQDENATLPVRVIAINTDDAESTAESWLSMDRAAAFCNLVYGEHGASQFQQLRDNRCHELISGRGTKGTKSYCILNSEQLIPFGFSPDDLRPWRLEKAS